MTTDLSALENALCRILIQNPGGLKEYEMITALRADGCPDLPPGPLGCRLTLFQTHFLVFHVLYRIRDRLWKEGRGHLEIHPLRIVLLPYQGSHAAMALQDPLRTYYLDLGQLEAVTEGDVDALLDRFWNKFEANEVRQDALASLGLREPVDFATIRRRYRILAKRHHPDCGGETRRLQAINSAMDVLNRYYRL